MDKKIIIPGWQSWTPTKKPFIRRQGDFSPHGIDSWKLEPSENLKKPVKGWCSWSAFGQNISEKKISDNAEKLKEGYVLIDDGWTLQGDWKDTNPKKFPNGMKFLATKIKSLGLKPGLHLAPFIADPKSKLAKTHPDYFVKVGRKNIEGFNLFPFKVPFVRLRYVLDMEKPEVYKYIQGCVENIVENWGFELLKLDFLYAIYFNPKYKDPVIPDQILKNFLNLIKKKYPKVYTIGCGCPLGPAAGLVDAMRISNDITSPQLNGLWPINKIINSQKLRQLENNLSSRKGFEKIWNIDPDVFIQGKETGFSQKQIQKLCKLIKSSKGLFFLGDDLTKVDPNTYF